MSLAETKLRIDASADISAAELDFKSAAGWGDLVGNIFMADIGGSSLLEKGWDKLSESWD
jgi:hypothetical protein